MSRRRNADNVTKEFFLMPETTVGAFLRDQIRQRDDNQTSAEKLYTDGPPVHVCGLI